MSPIASRAQGRPVSLLGATTVTEPTTSTATPSLTRHVADLGLESTSLQDEENQIVEIGRPYPLTRVITRIGQLFTTFTCPESNVPTSLTSKSQSTTVSRSLLTATDAQEPLDHARNFLAPRFWDGETQSNGIPPASLAGIIIGVLGSVTLLAGVLYVYLLRARTLRYARRRKKRKRRASSSAKSGSGAAPVPPPPPPAAADAPVAEDPPAEG